MNRRLSLSKLGAAPCIAITRTRDSSAGGRERGAGGGGQGRLTGGGGQEGSIFKNKKTKREPMGGRIEKEINKNAPMPMPITYRVLPFYSFLYLFLLFLHSLSFYSLPPRRMFYFTNA
jgi:hypothetical protein